MFVFILSACGSNEKLDPHETTGSETVVVDAKVLAMKEAQKKSVEFRLNIPYRSLDNSKSITKFGFGSCNDQDQDQPLWSVIQKTNPELFIMMGDNVYASRPETKPILNQYLKLNQNQDYRKFREEVPFLATWDDHDYGQNDGGETNPEKEEARNVFLNYWGYLKQTIPKNQKAIYHSRMIGKAPNRLQIIMLDTRWDRSDLRKNPNPEPSTPEGAPRPYVPHDDTSTRILSSAQWNWLEDELSKPSELKIIVSSIQFIPDGHGFEKWGNFPHEKKRMINLLKQKKLKNVVFLSGDRHLAAISKLEISKNQVIHEVTASALNRPSRMKTAEADESYIGESFGPINFGTAEIDWKKKTVQFDIRDVENNVPRSHVVKF